MLTVIIPAYNAQESLRRCVESVLAQTGVSLDVIVVDDGSTDGTLALARELEERVLSVSAVSHQSPVTLRVITQANGGLSVARNAGVAIARGEVITFVDADDWLVGTDVYVRLMEVFATYPTADILEYSVENRLRFVARAPMTIADWWFARGGYAHSWAWNKFYRREVFIAEAPSNEKENYSLVRGYEPGRLYEDCAFMASLLDSSLTIAQTPIVGIHYYDNPHGICNSDDGTARQQHLERHVELLKNLPLTTLAHVNYYMHVLNIQITLHRKTRGEWIMPHRYAPFRRNDLRHPRRLIKKLLNNAHLIKLIA